MRDFQVTATGLPVAPVVKPVVLDPPHGALLFDLDPPVR